MRSQGWSRARQAIGVLDIGTAKIACAVASEDDQGLALLGLGHQRSLGLKSGMVVDADAAERAVRLAVGQAERMAGVSLDRIALAISCGRIRSSNFTARAEIAGRIATDHDVGRILSGGDAFLGQPGRCVIQLTRSDWRLDGATGIRDPRGLAGRELAVDLSAITADDGPVRNLVAVVGRCHMAAERLLAAPYASAVGVASDEERRHGVLIVDFGAGVTSLAAFADGRLVHVDVVPVGGNHVTYDIARELVTSVAEAERIKTLYGTLVKAASNDAEMFTYPFAGDDEGGFHQTSKGFVAEVVRPRIDGLLDLVAERLGAASLQAFASGRVVLTGGASQLVGLDLVWSERFGGVVRIGRPQAIGRMPSSMCGPAFATLIGLLRIEAMTAHGETPGGWHDGSSGDTRSYVGRLQRWMRDSF